MICYHGSDTIVDLPKILEAKRPLDFGGGFYVTTSGKQAKSWAIKVSYRNNSNHRCVNRYEFDLEKAKAELALIQFDVADEEWLDFICDNRSGKPTGNYWCKSSLSIPDKRLEKAYYVSWYLFASTSRKDGYLRIIYGKCEIRFAITPKRFTALTDYRSWLFFLGRNVYGRLGAIFYVAQYDDLGGKGLRRLLSLQRG